MSEDIVAELAGFALDQAQTIGGWRGKFYVRDCLDVWRREYGDRVADAVAARVRGELQQGKKR